MATVQEFMTPNPATCRVFDTLYNAARLMQEYNCGAIPVLDQFGKCVGMITDRDICLQVVVDKLDPEETRLEQVISGEIQSCTPDDDINDVIAIMERHQIRRIPVIDMEDRVIGIVAQADIAIQGSKEQTAQLVGSVSK